MNRNFGGADQRHPSLLERQLQRCVDGELTEAEEQRLLSELDLQPECWRRLALLFVESRVLSTTLRTDWLQTQASEPLVDTGPSDRKSPRSLTALRWAALSLLLLLSYGVGRWSTPSTAPIAASNESPASDSIHAEAGSSGSLPAAAVEAAVNGELTGSLSAAASDPDAPELYVRVNLPGSDQTIEVPVYRAPEEWQPFTSRAVSSELEQSLRRAGYDVASTRQVLAVSNPSGPPILLPLESMDVQMARY